MSEFTPRDCPWPLHALRDLAPPSITNTTRVHQGDRALGLSELYFPAGTHKNKPIRAFGYYARPANPSDRLPAILLIHGGGGTARPWWARHWAQLGYAALAIDLYGQGPNEQKLPDGGPDWSNDFESFKLTDGRLENTWIFQVVSQCVAAITALSSLPEVDSNRIAVTGISWGGYFTCTVMSIDDRIRAGIPVCGAAFSPRVAGTTEHGRIQREAFEPGQFLPNCRKPVLWIDHPTDTPPDEMEKSYRACAGPNTLCITCLPHHNHPLAMSMGDRREPQIFLDSIFRNTDPLATLHAPLVESRQITVPFERALGPCGATLHFTTELQTPARDRNWQTTRATIDKSRILAEVPPGPALAYVALCDGRGAVVTSEFVHLT